MVVVVVVELRLVGALQVVQLAEVLLVLQMLHLLKFRLIRRSLPILGSDAATLTVLALDSNRNPVANVPVSVTLDSGVFKPDAKVTDDSGQVTGKIEIGANKSNRDIKYQLKAGTQSASGSVSVNG